MKLSKIDPCRIIKIEALDLPKFFEEDEGTYEMRYAHNPSEYQTFDIIDLKKELESINELESRAEFILDHLQNFKRVYINLDTGEITI